MKMLPVLFLGIALLVGCGGVLETHFDEQTARERRTANRLEVPEILSWRKGAEQGDAKAQHNLGVCYAFGLGVAKDDVIAYMWYNLAAASGHESGKKGRDLLAKRMTAEKIAEAQRLSRDWKRRRE